MMQPSFSSNACAVRSPTFSRAPEDAPHIARICHRL